MFGNGRAVALEENGFDGIDSEVIVDDGTVTVRPVILGKNRERAEDGGDTKRARTESASAS